MVFLLDTDTCVDLLRGVRSVLDRLKSLTPEDCAISAITTFELLAGATKARDPDREREKVRKLLAVIQEVAFDAKAALRAGALRGELEAAGTPIGPYDLLIAGQALALDLALVTANAREFGRVSGLRMENWR